MTPFSRALALAGLVSLCCTSGLAAGDEITLTNGGTIRGKVLSEDDAFVTVKTSAGKVKLPRGLVAEILRDEPKTPKPKASKPETSKPKTSKPKTSKPETSKPKTSKPETSKPEKSKPRKATSEPVGSVAEADSRSRRALRLLGTRSYPALEQELAGWNSGMMSNAFSSRYVYCGTGYLDRDLSALNAWCRARPKSAQAFFWRACYYWSTGWQIRGTGFANTVESGSWPKFHAFMQKARDDLERAESFDPTLIHVYVMQLRVGRTLSVGHGNLDRTFQKAIAVDPDWYEAYNARIWALLPKWGGSVEGCVGFARQSVKSRPNAPRLNKLLFLAHQDSARRSGDREAYHADPIVREDLDQAFRRLRIALPKNAEIHWEWGCFLQLRGEIKRAAKWLGVSAELGHTAAAYYHAIDLEYGRAGVTRSPKEAAFWYQQAVAQGHLKAHYRLARLFRLGAKGVPKAPDRAFDLYRLAAERGLPEAICGLGICYEDGVGVPKSLAQAKLEYSRAAAGGSKSGKAHLKRVELGLPRPTEQDKGHRGKKPKWLVDRAKRKVEEDGRARERAKRLKERRAKTAKRRKELKVKRAEKKRKLDAKRAAEKARRAAKQAEQE